MIDSSSVWACLPEHLAGLAEAQRRIGPMSYSGRRSYPVVDGTGILSVSGVLMKDDSWFSPTSYTALRRELRQMAADDAVRRLLVHIDSGGGQTRGLYDFVSELQAFGKRKWSFIEDLGASAAYAIAAATERIYANRTAMVGSLGTYAVLYDSSEAASKAGIRVHVVRAGKFKGAGVPGSDISAEHLSEVEKIVHQVNEQFLAVVQSGRRLSRGQVEAVADGRVHLAADAQRLGLIDGVRSLDSVFSMFSKVNPKETPMKSQEQIDQEIRERYDLAMKERIRAGDSPAEARSFLARFRSGLMKSYNAVRNRRADPKVVGSYLDGRD